VRLHALHVQGLDAPRGTQRLQVRTGYTVVVGGRADLQGLQNALLGLLYPEQALEDLVGRPDPDGSDGARAVLRVQLGSEVYQVGADLSGRRLGLAQFNPASNRFQRITTDPAEADQRLRELGRPERALVEALGLLTFPNAPEVPAASEPAWDDATPIAPVAAPRGPSERGLAGPETMARVEPPEQSSGGEQGEPSSRDLAGPQGKVLELEREEKHLESELRKYSVLAEADEDLELRIEQYRALREDCTRQLTALDQTRQSLLSERIQLQRVPSVRAPWIWAGMALGVIGGLAALLVEPLAGALGLIGLAVAGVAFGIGRRARRRLGRLEARIAALRVRERTLERRFEESAAPVRTPLVALELEGVDELADVLRLMRNVGSRLEEVRRELEEARQASKEIPPLGPTESLPAGEPEAPSEGSESLPWARPSAPPEPPRPSQPPTVGGGPEALLDAAARLAERSAAELWTEARPCLPLYLRAISGGHLREMVALGSDVWGVVREERGAVPIHALAPSDQRQVSVALQLALRERLAADSQLPLIVGPGAETFEGDPSGLGRALARLARVVQIVQLAETSEPWDSHATQVHRLE
jgi:hypothetical protein